MQSEIRQSGTNGGLRPALLLMFLSAPKRIISASSKAWNDNLGRTAEEAAWAA